MYHSDFSELEDNKFNDNSDYNFRSKNERSILPDLSTYHIPEDIKKKADFIYSNMETQTRRNRIRHQLIFYCTYQAYRSLGINVDPGLLGKTFGLKGGQIQRCSSMFSKLQTGFDPGKQQMSPIDCLRLFCQEIDLAPEAIDSAVLLAKSILRKDPTLDQDSPKTVAAGLFRYFAHINGIIFNKDITVITQRSQATIDAMYKRITTLDNN
jgi:transcription initiation factor TFIIIB Brf1 subunit/transcription initiation factor TFIIB